MEAVILIPGRRKSFDNYRLAVEAAGGRAVFSEESGALEWAGLLLPSGGDVEPWRYGMGNTASRDMDPGRDAAEFALLEKALAAGMPVLGICRGMQVLNVALGGTLRQDLPGHSRFRGMDRLHRVRGVDSLFTKLYGGRVSVNSAHHQAVERIGVGLRPVQWAPDGTVEALEHETLPVWGVQWHPERLRGRFAMRGTADGDLLFRTFVAQCAAAAKNERKWLDISNHVC